MKETKMKQERNSKCIKKKNTANWIVYCIENVWSNAKDLEHIYRVYFYFLLRPENIDDS